MKILLIVLMLVSLLGCSKQEIMQEAVSTAETAVDLMREMAEEPEQGTPDESAEEAVEEIEESVDKSDEVLEEAAVFAEDEDYASAIVLLQDAMEEDPDNADYQEAYADYCAAYKEQAIDRAEGRAMMEDYIGAIQILNSATALIGADEELSDLAQTYAAAQMDAVSSSHEETQEEPAEETETVQEPEQEQATTQSPTTTQQPAQSTGTPSENTPFYGIWCGASTSVADMQSVVDTLEAHGFDGRMFVTTEWSNLNQSASWYVVSAGIYATQDEANSMLDSVRTIYGDAYVKYSGNWQG